MADWWCRVVERETGVPRSWKPNTRDGVANIMSLSEGAQLLAGWLYRPHDLALPRKAAKATLIAGWQRPEGRLRRGPSRRWSIQDDALLLAHTGPDVHIAEQLGRSLKAVSLRRWRLVHRGEEPAP